MIKNIVWIATTLLCMMSQTAFPATSNDYFPLKPGTIWKYQVAEQEENIVTRKVLEKTVPVSGVETSVVKYIDDKLRTYFSNGSDGIFLYREYMPNVYVQGVGSINIDVTFEPPMQFGNPTFEIGDSIDSKGTAITRAAGRTFYFSYTANTTVEAAENITVQEVNYDTIRVRMDLTLRPPPEYGPGDFTITSIQNFAEGIGIVKEVSTDTDGLETTEELVYTNANIYDLAIISIAQPKRVTLSAATPTKTSFLKVKLQNKGPFEEIIENATILANLITVTAESLPPATCPAPTPVIHAGKPQKPFPITIKPGKTLTVYYDVTFDCANDAAKYTPDFRFSAVVDRAAIDEKADTNPVDDTCPRDRTSATDKGCGARKPDHTLGGDVTTDVFIKQ